MIKTTLVSLFAALAMSANAQTTRDPTVGPTAQAIAGVTQVPNLTSIFDTSAASSASAASGSTASEPQIAPAAFDLIRGQRGSYCFLFARSRYCPGDKFGTASVISVTSKAVSYLQRVK